MGSGGWRSAARSRVKATKLGVRCNCSGNRVLSVPTAETRAGPALASQPTRYFDQHRRQAITGFSGCHPRKG